MGTDPKETRKDAILLPTPMARRFVRYTVGFGVAVGIGLLPFLGKVAGVDALLDLFPQNLRGSLLPISIILMGLIAVGIQFYSGEALRPAALRRRFGVSWLMILAGLVLLLVFYNLFIIPVPIEAGSKIDPVIVGKTRIHGGSCGCTADLSDMECIQTLTTNPSAIETCWDSRSIRLRRLLLSLSYLAVIGGFAALVGLLLLQEDARKKQKRRRPRKAAPVPPASPPPQGTS